MPTIREWTEKDLLTIASLERSCFEDPWTIEMLRGEIAKPTGFGFLLETDGKAVGYACGSALFEDGEIDKVAVLSECRGKGYGKALVAKLLETAIARGAQRVFLEVRASNAPALGLYQSTGFEKTRLRKRYYENGEDALEMKRELYPEE